MAESRGNDIETAGATLLVVSDPIVSMKRHNQPPHVFPTVLTLVAAYVASTAALILVNKNIYAAFPWPIMVLFCHQASCWLVTALMTRAGAMAVPAVPRRNAALIGITMVLGIVSYTYSLNFNSVTVHQLFKMACLPCVALLQRVLFGQPMPSGRVVLSLVILILGGLMSTKQDYWASLVGLAAAAVGMLMTALAQVSIQHMKSMKSISGIQIVAALSPAATLGLVVLVLIIELPEMQVLALANPAHPPVPYGLIAMSCIFALLSNWLGNSLIKQTSALTFQVVGHLQTILFLFLGAIFSASEEAMLSSIKLMGVIVSFGALIAYTFFKMNPEPNRMGSLKGVITNSMANNPILWIKMLSWTSLLLLVILCTSLVTRPMPTVIYERGKVLQEVKVPSEQINIADLTTTLWAMSRNSERFKYDRRPNLKDSTRGKPSVVVISADNRPLVSLDSVHDADPRNLPYVTASTIYKQWWAVRHGYDYRHISISSPPGWYGTWAKVKAMYSMLFKYDYVIFLDADAFVNTPEIDLDWMIDHWGFHANATFLMAGEPEHSPWPNNNPDNNAVNTGFVVIRSNDLSKRVLREMMQCPAHIEDCIRWRTNWAHEQTVFNMVMRGKLVMPEDLVIVPCAEANGWWAETRPDEARCNGKHITHAWARAGKRGVSEKVSMLMLREHFRLYERLLKEHGYHVMSCNPWVEGTDEQCPDPDEPRALPSNQTQP